MKGVRVCSNKGPGPLQRGDNHKNVKMGWGHLKISRTTGPILTRLGTNHPLEQVPQRGSIHLKTFSFERKKIFKNMNDFTKYRLSSS
jgi:hypothetical protein